MDKLMRNYIDVYCSFQTFSSGVSNTHIVKLTDDFVTYAESTIKIERDGMSGTMTSVVYEIKLAKSRNTLFLKSAFEAFTSKDFSYSFYDSIINQDYVDMIDEEIPVNSFADIFSSYEGHSGDNFVNPKDIKLILCFAKDNAIDRTQFDNSSSVEDILSYSGFQRVVISDIDYETYDEDFDYISVEASALELQRYLKSKGDFTYDIPVADLEPNLEDVWFQHQLDIPSFSEHTTPYYNPSDGSGVSQSLLPTYKLDGIGSYYLPTIRWDGDLIGIDKDFKSSISFGSQSGKPLMTVYSERAAEQYLVKNLGNKSADIRIKGDFDFFCKYRCKLGSPSVYNNDHNHLFQSLKVSLYAVKDETSGRTLLYEQSYEGFFEPVDNYWSSSEGYWSTGRVRGGSQVENFNFDLSLSLAAKGGYNAIILVVTLDRVALPKGESFSSIFYFTENTKITTTISNTQSNVSGNKELYDGFPVVKGVRPHFLLEHIMKKKWNESFNVRFIDDGDIDAENPTETHSSLLPELGAIPSPKTVFLASESLSYKDDAQFHIDVLEILKWYQLKGYEYSIINNNVMLLAPREYFYNNKVNSFGGELSNTNTISYNGGTELFEQGSMSLKTNSSLCYTEVKYGFQKINYEVFAGSCDPVSVMKYDTGYLADDNKTLDLITKIRMDFYGMFYLLYRMYGEEIDKTNDTTFALDCKVKDTFITSSSTSPNQVGVVKDLYQIWDYIKAVVLFKQNNLEKEITYFNALNIPKVALWLYNLKYMRIFARELTFVSSDNYNPEIGNIVIDTAMIASDGIVGTNGGASPLFADEIKGKVDVTLPKITVNKPLDTEKYQAHFSLAKANVKVGSLRKIWAVNGIDNPNKIIRFVDNEGIIRYGFVNSYEYNFWNNESAEMELLLAKPKIKKV